MSSRGPATNDDVEVTWEDQQKICAFGRLSGKAHELQSLVSAKEVYSVYWRRRCHFVFHFGCIFRIGFSRSLFTPLNV